MREDEPRSFGLARLLNSSEVVPFMADDLFVDSYCVAHCDDISKIVREGEQVRCLKTSQPWACF